MCRWRRFIRCTPLLVLPEAAVGAAMSWLIVLHVVIAGWAMLCTHGIADLIRDKPGGRDLLHVAGKWLLHVPAAGYIMIPLAWLPLVLLAGASH